MLALLTAAFFGQRCADIEYIDRNGTKSTRIVEAQFPYLNMPVW